jgi:long-chain acyl-CoA synthetase
MLLATMVGGRQVLVPRFAPVEVMRTIETHRPTLLLAVPSMFAVLLGVHTERQYDLTSLSKCVSGGAPLPMDVYHAWRERVGTELHEGYGPTEASPVVSVVPLDRSRPGSAGLPIASVEIRILDDEGRDVPAGEIGEVAVRGPNVFAGYWRDEEATQATMHGEWLLTGDLGRLDEEGYLYIVDRKKDLIIVGGMNVYPSEVEQVLYRLPQVAQAAVVGVPNPLRGEDVVAVLALKPEAELSEKQVIDACAAEMASFKAPRRVVFWPELPMSPTGKVLKRELREIVRDYAK